MDLVGREGLMFVAATWKDFPDAIHATEGAEDQRIEERQLRSESQSRTFGIAANSSGMLSSGTSNSCSPFSSQTRILYWNRSAPGDDVGFGGDLMSLSSA
jgi:hypothetical protein